MAVAAKFGLLSICASMLPLKLVSGVKTNGPMHLMRKESPIMNTTRRASERMQALLDANGMFPDDLEYEVGHNTTMAASSAPFSTNMVDLTPDWPDCPGDPDYFTSDPGDCECRRRRQTFLSETYWTCKPQLDVMVAPSPCASNDQSACESHPMYHCIWTANSCQARGTCASFSGTDCVNLGREQKSPKEYYICEGPTCNVDDCCYPSACPSGYQNAGFRGFWSDMALQTHPWTSLIFESPSQDEYGSVPCTALGCTLADCAARCNETAGCNHFSFMEYYYKYECIIYKEYVGLESSLRVNDERNTACVLIESPFNYSDTIQCLQKLQCYTLMVDKPTSFLCECILGMPVDAVDETLCADWLNCLENETQAQAFVAEAIEVLYHLRSPYPGSSSSLLLQQSSGRQDTIEKDHPNCTNPEFTNETDLECACWDELSAACLGNTGNDLYECLRKELCASPGICHSWKVPADTTSDGMCEAHEIKGSTTASLAVQGNRRAERTMFADIFQGRRQPPQNISSMDPAELVLEESLSSKPCTEGAR